MPRLRQNQPDFAVLSVLLRGHGANGATLSNALRCAPVTARKKLAEPKYFTLEDLEMAARYFHIPFDTMRDSIIK